MIWQKKVSSNNIPFKVENENYTYLGVEIAGTIPTIFKYNFKALLDVTKGDVNR